MTLRVMQGIVIIAPIHEERTTDGGIILEAGVSAPNLAVIINVHEKIAEYLNVVPGDRIMFNKFAAKDLPGTDGWMAISPSDIIAVIEAQVHDETQLRTVETSDHDG